MSKNEVNESSSVIPPSLRKIGKVTGIHGLKGEIFVYVFSKDISWIDGLEEVILEDAKGVRKTFPVTSLRPFKEGFLAFVEGIADRTSAENLRAHLVYVNAELFVTEEGDDSFYLSEIEGFTVFDKELRLGVIEAFSTNTVQDLLVIGLDDGTKAEIPLVEDFLIEIKFDLGQVIMDLPPGLLEAQQQEVKS